MSDVTPTLPVIVIGGGISGLTCAYRLQRAGIAVRLLDASNRTGGVISTVEENGFRFELGPQNFLGGTALLQLTRELGLESDLLRADSRAPRYILLHGRLVSAPIAPPSLLTTSLLGASAKWDLFTEMFRHSKPPKEDESIAAFVRRKFGTELLDHMVGPMVSGIFAGDPEKLSLRAAFPRIHEFESAYGSVLRGAIKSRPPKDSNAPKPPRAGLCSFLDGMEALTRALAAHLGDVVVSGVKVTAVHRDAESERLFQVEVERNGQRETLQARAVILACPAYVAAAILKSSFAKLEKQLSQIEYAPLAVIAAGYRREQISRALHGFGFLVPRIEGLRLLGNVWNSSLFPGRAPEGMVSVTSFAGGATDPAMCNLSADEIAELISAELARVLQITGSPVARIVRPIPQALPQYNLGHLQTVAALHSHLAPVHGLFITGNYLTGPSLGNCVEQANRTAEAAAAHLASTGAMKTDAVAGT